MQNCQLSIFQRILFFQHTTRISHILFQHTSPIIQSPHSTTTRKFQHTFSIYVGISNIKHIFPTHFSNILIYKRRRGAFAPLPVYLLFLPTHSSYLLLYPLSDTLQELFQHIHSIDGNLSHEIICFFQFRPQNPILRF